MFLNGLSVDFVVGDNWVCWFVGWRIVEGFEWYGECYVVFELVVYVWWNDDSVIVGIGEYVKWYGGVVVFDKLEF